MFGFIHAPSPAEMMLILAVGVLLFGKRLPEVGKNIGKGLLEFKRGVNDYKDEALKETSDVKEEKRIAPSAAVEEEEHETAAKFETPA